MLNKVYVLRISSPYIYKVKSSKIKEYQQVCTKV